LRISSPGAGEGIVLFHRWCLEVESLKALKMIALGSTIDSLKVLELEI
jgi:hypothetical protein